MGVGLRLGVGSLLRRVRGSAVEHLEANSVAVFRGVGSILAVFGARAYLNLDVSVITELGKIAEVEDLRMAKSGERSRVFSIGVSRILRLGGEEALFLALAFVHFHDLRILAV